MWIAGAECRAAARVNRGAAGEAEWFWKASSWSEWPITHSITQVTRRFIVAP